MRFRDWLTLTPVFVRSLGRLPLGHLLYMARQLRNENPHRHDGRLHINTFFPPYPSPAFERFMRSAIERRRVPYSTYFAVTDECPYHCPHCSYAGRPAGHLTTEQAKEVIRQILAIGTVTVGFTGGEPLMRDDIAELVAAASGKGSRNRSVEKRESCPNTETTEKRECNHSRRDSSLASTQSRSDRQPDEERFSWRTRSPSTLLRTKRKLFYRADHEPLPGAATVLFTTGHRLTAELAVRLREAGLDCMMIGLESANAARHDATRGVSGSFDEAMAAIRLSLESGLYTAISTVATHGKLACGDIRAMTELGERMGVHEFRILEPIPTGRLAGEIGEMLCEEESRTLADFHRTWNRRGQGPAVAAFSYLESPEMFGCGAGFHHLFVDSLGNVCPCDLTPLSFGNVLDEPLSDIWETMGLTFDKARCRCLMNDLCTSPLLKSSRLPLAPAKSLGLCRAYPTDPAIPEVYRRL